LLISAFIILVSAKLNVTKFQKENNPTIATTNFFTKNNPLAKSQSIYGILNESLGSSPVIP